MQAKAPSGYLILSLKFLLGNPFLAASVIQFSFCKLLQNKNPQRLSRSRVSISPFVLGII